MGLDAAVGAWTVVMPVKVLSAAKTRLTDTDAAPAALALAFFTDTLSAVLATPAVAGAVVVTADARVRLLAESAGAVVVDDAAHPGINAAAQWGASHRVDGTGSAVVVSDLPSLTPAALTAALGLAGLSPTSFLADADDTGTTMWFAAPDQPIDPRFGPHSRRAHRESGAVDLVIAHTEHTAALWAARLDIDTADALERALAAGVGPATTHALTAAAAPG